MNEADNISDYTSRQMAYYDGSGGVGSTAQIMDSFYNTPISQIIPGSFKISRLNAGVAQSFAEGTDFTIDYVNGTITVLNAALAVDVSEGGLFETAPGGAYDRTGNNYFTITFENMVTPISSA